MIINPTDFLFMAEGTKCQFSINFFDKNNQLAAFIALPFNS